MKKLRILKICEVELGEGWYPFALRLMDSKVTYVGRLKSLSNNLRLLYWHGCPFKFPSNFYPENIVAIDLSYSHLKTLWTTPKCFGRLKVMKLRHYRNLKSSPDFTRITNLEELILEGCVNLVKVHPSFGMLKKLVVLNMRDCKRFRSFPCKVEMDSLEVLHLSGCSKVEKLPEFFSTIQTLREFSFDGTGIMDIPSFVFSQHNLRVLKFGLREEKRSRRWTPISQLSWLPSKKPHPQTLVMPSLADLCFLQDLNLSHSNISEVSESIGGLPCLKLLDLAKNNFTSLPGCLSQLSGFISLNLSGCKKLEVLHGLPPDLWNFVANDYTSLYQIQPNSYLKIPTCMLFGGCPNLFRNVSIGSQLCTSQPQPNLSSSITSHISRNEISSFLQFTEFPSNTCGIFGGQDTQFSRLRLDIGYHGNIIPQWFTNTSMGNYIQVELPLNFCYNKVRGYAICAVLTPKSSYYPKLYQERLWYAMNNFDGTHLPPNHALLYSSCRNLKQDIILFHFLAENRNLVEAKNFVSFSFQANDDVEMRECGVRLVFYEDIQEKETGLSITQDLPTLTQDGGYIVVSRSRLISCWSW